MAFSQEELARLANLIQGLGYRAQISDVGITTSMAGLSVLVFYESKYSIQMYLGLLIDDSSGFGPEQCNEFNKSYKFVKSYLRDNSVGFEGDFFFDVDASDAHENLEKI